MNALSQPFAALILSAAVLPWMASAETPAASSNTVIGPNVMLADGALTRSCAAIGSVACNLPKWD